LASNVTARGRLAGIASAGGEALFRGVEPSPRYVIPTLGRDELPPDSRAMRADARKHRVPVFDLGRLPCLGRAKPSIVRSFETSCPLPSSRGNGSPAGTPRVATAG
jgi:hypothetical protein